LDLKSLGAECHAGSNPASGTAKPRGNLLLDLSLCDDFIYRQRDNKFRSLSRPALTSNITSVFVNEIVAD
jgi:hypothetical protein